MLWLLTMMLAWPEQAANQSVGAAMTCGVCSRIDGSDSMHSFSPIESGTQLPLLIATTGMRIPLTFGRHSNVTCGRQVHLSVGCLFQGGYRLLADS